MQVGEETLKLKLPGETGIRHEFFSLAKTSSKSHRVTRFWISTVFDMFWMVIATERDRIPLTKLNMSKKSNRDLFKMN